MVGVAGLWEWLRDWGACLEASVCWYYDDAQYTVEPFPQPSDIAAGDYIEIGMLGAYGAAMATGFNGFGNAAQILVADEPMESLSRGDRVMPEAHNVVALR